MSVTAMAEARLTVFAAASLKGALDEAVAEYPQRVIVSYGGSGLLARQIAQGAPADVVILASEAWMEWLASEMTDKLLIQKSFLGNRLVLIGPEGVPETSDPTSARLLEQLDGGRLAIGMTDSVPAGIYGRQWLMAMGMWEDVAPHLAQTDNVRAALALVARAEAPLGITYASDAAAEPAVGVVYAIPPDFHDPISYPVAVIDTKNTAEALELVKFLSSSPAVDIFLNHGFLQAGAAQ